MSLTAYSPFLLIIFVVSLLSYVIFYRTSKLNNSFLRKIFYVPARKSKTNAIMLGGLPFSLVAHLGIITALKFLPVQHMGFIKIWLMASAIVIFYGYLDDRYELRPVIKILFQAASVFIITFESHILIGPQYPLIQFFLIFSASLGLLNGTNLLDGLDTLSLKLHLITYGLFCALGLYLNLHDLTLISSILAVSLSSFYFFNKEPAKIHLGEIGSVYIGVSQIALSILLYKGLIGSPAMSWGKVNCAFLALCPLAYAHMETAISIIRRIINGRSPFVGDRLHFHYLLQSKFRLNAANTSTLYALGHLIIQGIFFLFFTLKVFPIFAFCLHAGLYGLMQLSIAYKEWRPQNPFRLSAKVILGFMRKKQVMVIESSSVEDFEFDILKDDESDSSSKKDVA